MSRAEAKSLIEKNSGKILSNVNKKLDYLIIGGAMANTFLKAQGFEVGISLIETEMIKNAEKIISSLKSKKCVLPLFCFILESSVFAYRRCKIKFATE